MQLIMLAATAFGLLPVLAQLHASDVEGRDWHIGCADTGTCSYYDDHHSLEPRQTAPPFPPQLFPCKDRICTSQCDEEGFCDDQRSLEPRQSTGLGPHQFNDTSDSDSDVAEYQIISRDTATSRTTDSALQKDCTYYCDDGCCHIPCFHGRCYFDDDDEDKLQLISRETLTPRTTDLSIRCAPGLHNIVQYLDVGQDKWINYHTCGVACETVGQSTVCRQVNGQFHVPEPDRPDGPDELPSTRCDPSNKRWMQHRYEASEPWKPYYLCEHACENQDGYAACKISDDNYFVPKPPSSGVGPTPTSTQFLPAPQSTIPGIMVSDPPSFVIPSKSTLTIGSDPPSFLVPSMSTIVPRSQMTAPGHVIPPTSATGDIVTRCDPLQRQMVQHLLPGSGTWVSFYPCGDTCVQFDQGGACRTSDDSYFFPSPPDIPSFVVPSISTLTVPAITTLTVPAISTLTVPVVSTLTVPSISTVTIVSDPPSFVVPPLATPTTPVSLNPGPVTAPPDFHTHPTRCNPGDLSEIQVMKEGGWAYFYTCTFEGTCIDVDGRGACRLNDNVYEYPAANYTSVKQGAQEFPLNIPTKCSEFNETEVLEWNGTNWAYSGVCLEPFICYDFDGEGDCAVCTVRDLASPSNVWLPWSSLSAPTENGLMARCRDEMTVEEFTPGQGWLRHRQCPAGFVCAQLSFEPGNAGCVAPNINEARRSLQSATKARRDMLHEDGADVNDEAIRLYGAIFGSQDQNMSASQTGSSSQKTRYHRRSDGSLIDDSSELYGEGEHLEDEGSKLVGQSRKLLRAIFGDKTERFIANMNSGKDTAETRRANEESDSSDSEISPQ